MPSCLDDPAHYAPMTGLLRWRAGIVAISDMPTVFCFSYPNELQRHFSPFCKCAQDLVLQRFIPWSAVSQGYIAHTVSVSKDARDRRLPPRTRRTYSTWGGTLH